MEAEAAKYIGAGLATIALAGVGLGLGVLFGNFLSGALRNPTAVPKVQPIMMLSIPVMIWTLLWVARAPLQGAQYPKRGIANILTTPTGRISRLQYIAGLVTILILVGVVFGVQAIVAGIAPPVAFLSKAALQSEIRQAGFEIVETRYFDKTGISPFIVARKPDRP